jgi:hypothetical protein
MKLLVRQIGNDAFPRYAIMCENHTWWTGEEWSPDEAKALRFASLSVVRDNWKQLQERMDATSDGVTQLECQMRVSLNKKLTQQQIMALAWYLSRASQFFLDYSQSRPDGFEDACISTQIVWASLKEAEKKPPAVDH